LALLACAACVSAVKLTEKAYQQHFGAFVKKYEKRYESDDFFNRFEIFKSNLDVINEHNEMGKSYTLAVNEFADMTNEEFTQKMTGLRYRQNDYIRSLNAPELKDIKIKAGGSLDWRSNGKVTPVKNQGQCGSCWAFSATGAIEAAWAIAKDTTAPTISEQELVDCSRGNGNHGCNGGWMDYAFEYVVHNGICSEASYPYTARDGTCKNKQCESIVTIKGYKDTPKGSESSLMSAIHTGPISIAIEASGQAFQFYSSGVFDGRCGERLDHGVLLVGYDTDAASGKDYWIVKNSWGTTWGDKGYIKFIRDRNQCGMSNAASYPVV
jgi:xylem cysteine proteinase